MMILQPRLSTIDTPERYGGLLICGLNYALRGGATPQMEADFLPWAEYFTHKSNRTSDKFVSRIALWFDWWGIPLEANGSPTDLNCAISQTNLFYDSSKSFASRSTEEIQLAFNRLQAIITRLDNSGLLITSVSMAEWARIQLSAEEWQTNIAGKFSLRVAMAGCLRIAVCPHPRNPQMRCDLESVSKGMQDWTNDVLKEWRRKQQAVP